MRTARIMLAVSFSVFLLCASWALLTGRILFRLDREQAFHLLLERFNVGLQLFDTLDLRQRLFGLMAAIGQRHIRPGGGKGKSDALANACCAAGDEGLTAGEVERIVHGQ